MHDANCIFCKIVAGDMPSTQIYEDQDFLVIFDAFPFVDGQALLMSKNHIDSRFEEVPDEVLSQGIIVAKTVSLTLKKAFDSDRVVQLTEGLQVAHMHMKLFPVEDPGKFSMGMLNEIYPQSREMLSPDQFKRLKEKFEKAKEE